MCWNVWVTGTCKVRSIMDSDSHSLWCTGHAKEHLQQQTDNTSMHHRMPHKSFLPVSNFNCNFFSNFSTMYLPQTGRRTAETWRALVLQPPILFCLGFAHYHWHLYLWYVLVPCLPFWHLHSFLHFIATAAQQCPFGLIKSLSILSSMSKADMTSSNINM